MLLILWDYDGTLANSERKFKRIVEAFLREKINNLVLDINKFTDEFYFKNCAGKKYTETFKILGENNIFNYSKLTEKDWDDFLVFANEKYKIIEKGEITFTENMDKVLAQLDKDKNIVMSIATNSIRQDLILKCKALDNQIINKILDANGFSVHDMSENYEHLNLDKYQGIGKPNPAIFIYAYEHIIKNYPNIDKIIVVEDSTSGVKAGYNFKNDDFMKTKVNKISIVGYTAGEHKPNGDKLLENGADVILDNADSLLNFIIEYK